MASVEGSLSKIGVPELFRSIARERRTGSLTLTRSGAEARVFFRDGGAYHARSIGSGIQLGARLISAGAITQDDLNDALALQRSEGGARRLGQILLETGLVTAADLQTIVTQQIEDTIFEILRWDGGEFRFDQDVRTDEDIGLHVSVENLVMEGARRFREWHQITRRVPTLDAIPVFNENSAEIDVALTPEEWAFVSRVDGRSTVKELAIGCGFTDLEAGRTVFGLITAGLLDIELPEGIELPVDDADLDEVFDELERALQEAATPKPDAAGSQPTLEELITGTETEREAEEDYEYLDRNYDDLAQSHLEGEVPQLAAEELPMADETLDTLPPTVPLGQEWGSAQPEESPELPEVPMGHDWATIMPQEPDDALQSLSGEEATQYRSVTDAIEGEASLQEVPLLQEPVAVEEIPLVEEPVAVEEIPFVQEPVAVEEIPFVQEPVAVEEIPLVEEPVASSEDDGSTSNGVHSSHPLPADSGSWGDLRVEGVHEEEVRASVIIEESVPPRESPSPSANPSLARLFAELSMPQQTSERHPPPPASTPALEEPQASKQEVSEQRPTPRPVDPSVDTTALLREFSGLGLTDEQASPDWGQVDAPRRAAASPDPDKGRGLFGKKRK